MRERDSTRKYQLEIGGAALLYVVVLFFCLRTGKALEDGTGRTVLMLAPLLPAVLMVWAFMRHLRRMDEFVRLRSLQALAIGGGVTAVFSLTWGFLENAGFQRLSMFTVWMVFGASWGLASVWQGVSCRLEAR